jgi:CRP-like cAMP-binding protein
MVDVEAHRAATSMTREALQTRASLPTHRPRQSRGPLRQLGIVQWVRQVRRGEQLFHQGELAEGAFLISRGRVRMVMSSATGLSREMAVARSGEIIGLSAAIAGKPHQVTAEAVTPCKVGFIRRDDLLHLIRDESEVCFYILQCLSADIAASYIVLRDLVSTHSRKENGAARENGATGNGAPESA